MRSIFAGNVAQIALDALAVVYACYRLVMKIEITPVSDARDAASDDVADAVESFFVKVI